MEEAKTWRGPRTDITNEIIDEPFDYPQCADLKPYDHTPNWMTFSSVDLTAYGREYLFGDKK